MKDKDVVLTNDPDCRIASCGLGGNKFCEDCTAYSMEKHNKMVNETETVIEINEQGDLTEEKNVKQTNSVKRKRNNRKLKSNLTVKKAKEPSTSQGAKTPPEVVAHIIGAYLSGQFQNNYEIAIHIGTSESNVKKIIQAIPPEYVTLKDAAVNAEIANAVVDFIKDGFKSLRAIDEHIQDKTWLMNQSAAEIATLYGVKADKLMKIMELIERANTVKAEGE